MNERYAVMWSGGKDCALALSRARAAGLPVERLLTFYDPESGRLRFHETPLPLVSAQATSLGMELQAVPAEWSQFGARLRETLAHLAEEGFTGVVFGDVHLEDVRAWYETIVREAGLEHVEPIWGEPPADLLREYVSAGGRALVICVDLTRLDANWLGTVTNEDFVTQIAEAGVDAVGENGEFHTFAFAGPPLRSFIRFRWPSEQRLLDGRFLQLLLEPGD